MQYEPSLDRAGLTALVLDHYLASLDARDLAATLDCFHDEALFCVQTAFFRRIGKPAIAQMFTVLFGEWQGIAHRNAILTVDEAHGRVAASFDLMLTAADGRVARYSDTAFWRVRDGKFQEVTVYSSGPNMFA